MSFICGVYNKAIDNGKSHSIMCIGGCVRFPHLAYVKEDLEGLDPKHDPTETGSSGPVVLFMSSLVTVTTPGTAIIKEFQLKLIGQFNKMFSAK
ncbi:hypothetical protein J6590_094565 [Homalodisca vitripennis]|nr:hypothetical protein J6590_094565 [Homalodisca vitripennis]